MELRAERDVGLGKVQVLEVSNGELFHGQADRRTRLAKRNSPRLKASTSRFGLHAMILLWKLDC